MLSSVLPGGLSAFALLYHVALAEAKQKPSKYSLRVYNMLAIALRDLGSLPSACGTS